jgi:hypothetical protein
MDSSITSPLTSPIRQAQFVMDETTRIKSPRIPESNKKVLKLTDSFLIKIIDNVCIFILKKLLFLKEIYLFKMANSFKKQKLFSYLYNENTNYKTQQLFVDSFLITNSLKGLSNLTVASFTEDEYGIVQQTLPEIITTFINLQKVLLFFQFCSYSVY